MLALPRSLSSSLSSPLSSLSSPSLYSSFSHVSSPSLSLFLRSSTRIHSRYHSTESNTEPTTITPTISIEERKRTRDQLLHTFTKNLRISIINNTKTAARAQELHNLGPIESQLLGKTMAGVSLLASFLEGEERIIATLTGRGPVASISAEALHVGEVRGHVILPDGKALTTSKGALKEGYFRLTKILYGHSQPVTSTVELQNGDITSEFSLLFEKSDQVPSAVLLETLVDSHGKIEFSGGIVAQTLPKAPADIIEKTQALFSKSSFAIDFMMKKKSLNEMLHELIPEEITEQIERTQVDFFCRCGLGSFKTKMSALGHEELTNLQQNNQREVKCVNCSKLYTMSDTDFDDMHQMLDQREREKKENASEQQ